MSKVSSALLWVLAYGLDAAIAEGVHVMLLQTLCPKDAKKGKGSDYFPSCSINKKQSSPYFPSCSINKKQWSPYFPAVR